MKPFESIDPRAETADHGDHVAETARQRAIDLATAGVPLTVVEFAAILRISVSRFYRLAKAGAFEDFRLKPALGPKAYSGVLVARWLRGDVVHDVRVFGRKRKAS
jgi:hypothetical protein